MNWINRGRLKLTHGRYSSWQLGGKCLLYKVTTFLSISNVFFLSFHPFLSGFSYKFHRCAGCHQYVCTCLHTFRIYITWQNVVRNYSIRAPNSCVGNNLATILLKWTRTVEENKGIIDNPLLTTQNAIAYSLRGLFRKMNT